MPDQTQVFTRWIYLAPLIIWPRACVAPVACGYAALFARPAHLRARLDLPARVAETAGGWVLGSLSGAEGTLGLARMRGMLGVVAGHAVFVVCMRVGVGIVEVLYLID